jgi:hypothetical protein
MSFYWVRGSVGKNFFGQVTMEFTFGLVAIVLLIVGMIKVMAWCGRDLIDRRAVHEAVLIQPIGQGSAQPLIQVRPFFYGTTDMNAAINSNIFGAETP